MKDGYSAYKTANVDTSDQGKLIVIAYDVAIKHCKLAIEKFSDKTKIEERTKHLFKVQDAITELMSALKMDAGDIAKNLYMLYDYMLRRVVHANAHNEPGCIEEILVYLNDLRSAWKEAIVQLKGASAQGESSQPGSITMTG